MKPLNVKLRDVTGMDVSGVPIPECPKHKGEALVHEIHYRNTSKEVSGFFRCPTDNKVYIIDDIIADTI